MDKEAGESNEHLVLTGKCSPSPTSQRHHCDSTVSQCDAPDALTNSQTPEGGSPHQQMIASLHQGLTHPHLRTGHVLPASCKSPHGQVLSTQGLPSMLATPADTM